MASIEANKFKFQHSREGKFVLLFHCNAPFSLGEKCL